MSQERRRYPRVTLIAEAEVTDVGSEARSRARIADISSQGCYVETVNPLPLGSEVRLRIRHGGETFEAEGVVVNSQPYMGMGVVFAKVAPEHHDLLKKWLVEPG
jgi:hypothetical protein